MNQQPKINFSIFLESDIHTQKKRTEWLQLLLNNSNSASLNQEDIAVSYLEFRFCCEKVAKNFGSYLYRRLPFHIQVILYLSCRPVSLQPILSHLFSGSATGHTRPFRFYHRIISAICPHGRRGGQVRPTVPTKSDKDGKAKVESTKAKRTNGLIDRVRIE